MANLSNINNKFIVTDGNNGRVLIGATNDIGATLFANHPSTTAPSLTFNAPAGQVFENEDLQFAFGLNNASPFNGYMQTRFVSAPYYRNLAINPLGGDVGIGTNSPATKLHIDGGDLRVRDSGNVSIQIVSSDSGQSAIQFGDDGDTNDGRIVYMNATDLMRFFTNDGEKMVIDSSGNVGIGTDSPTNLLTINDPNANGSITDTIPSWWGLVIDRAYTTSSSAAIGLIGGTVASGSSGRLYLGNSDDVDNSYIDGGANQLHFGVGGEKMRIDSSGDTTHIASYGGGTMPFRVGYGSYSSFTPTFQIDDNGNVNIVGRNSGAGNTSMKLIFDNTDVTVEANQLGGGIEWHSDDGSGAGAGIKNSINTFFTGTGGYTDMRFSTAGTDGNNQERVRIDSSGNVRFTGTAPNSGDEITQLNFYNTSSSINLARITGIRQAGGTNYGALTFSTTNSGTISERMRITSAGDVCVGTDTGRPDSASDPGVAIAPAGKFYIYSTSDFGVYNTNTTGKKIYFRISNTEKGSIQFNTNSVAYNTTSDYRLKENVVEMTGALDRVSQLKPSRFNFIGDVNVIVDGFLAHEVQEIVPEAISGEKDAVDEDGNPDYQGIDQSKLVPLLVGAIQELKAEIELLKSK